MSFKALTKIALVPVLLLASVAQAAPMYINTAATGSSAPGDTKFQVADDLFFGGALGTDADHTTGLFDTMVFGIDPAENLTTVSTGSIGPFSLSGTFITSYGATESIGLQGSDLALYVEWDNSTDVLGEIAFWFTDPNDTNALDDTRVASGNITSLSATSLVADLDFLYANFWNDQYGNSLVASTDEPFRISMSVQSNGSSVDVTAVPEPSILALFALGLVGVGMTGLRKQHKTDATL